MERYDAPMRWLAFITLGCGLVINSCGAPVTCEEGYQISPAARMGCRSPSDMNCMNCCVKQPSGCLVKFWLSSGITGVTPWYNTEQLRTSCPTGCMPCASCLAHDEESLCQMLSSNQMSCDCTKVNPGSDPCSRPMSCECYCSNITRLGNNCPAL